MRNARAMLWPLTFGLAISGCASNGAAVKPVACPVLPPVPASLLQAPTFEQQVRETLFEQPPKLTSGSAASRK